MASSIVLINEHRLHEVQSRAVWWIEIKGEAMRLNRQAEIAIAILVACARVSGRTMRTSEIAMRAEASKDSAAQVILLLSREGFLTTTRGRFGGVALALPPREILLGDVLRRIQPELFENCAREDDSQADAPAAVFNMIVGAAEATFLAFMDRFCVADLLDCRKETPLDKADHRLHEIIWAQPNPRRLRQDEFVDQLN